MSAHYVGQVAPNYIHSTMQANSDDDSFTFTVGKLDAGMAILIGDKASLIEFPSLLLPSGVSSGSVVNIRVMRNDQQERRQKDEFDQLQEDILHTFGQQSPKAPALRLRNVTQTSVTLEWDRLSLATATLLSLDIYRNGQRLAPIPNPLHNTSTKLSGLDLNAEYTFHLVLKTTAGTLTSPVIKTRTHTISDTSGISVCFGHVHDAEMLEASKQALSNMKAKWSDRIQIDTTHYVCTDPRNPGHDNAPEGSQGAGYAKAMQLSIPAVLPHWVFACHDQKKMVGISPFYLDQDPPNASSVRQTIDQLLGKQAQPPAATAAQPQPQRQRQTYLRLVRHRLPHLLRRTPRKRRRHQQHHSRHRSQRKMCLPPTRMPPASRRYRKHRAPTQHRRLSPPRPPRRMATPNRRPNQRRRRLRWSSRRASRLRASRTRQKSPKWKVRSRRRRTRMMQRARWTTLAWAAGPMRMTTRRRRGVRIERHHTHSMSQTSISDRGEHTLVGFINDESMGWAF